MTTVVINLETQDAVYYDQVIVILEMIIKLVILMIFVNRKERDEYDYNGTSDNRRV